MTGKRGLFHRLGKRIVSTYRSIRCGSWNAVTSNPRKVKQIGSYVLAGHSGSISIVTGSWISNITMRCVLYMIVAIWSTSRSQKI